MLGILGSRTYLELFWLVCILCPDPKPQGKKWRIHVPYRVCAITDEFSPDLETALRCMKEIGMTGAELRVVNGKNILDLTNHELNDAIAAVGCCGMEIVSIAAPLMKSVLPDAPPVEERWRKDSFGSHHKFEDEPCLAERAFKVAERTGARIIRVFSYWRTIDPTACHARIIEALNALAIQAGGGVVIALENEHACNIATGADLAAIEPRLYPRVKFVWDPANACVAGETSYPDGYNKIPVGRIAHVHVKDVWVRVADRIQWVQLGTGDVYWPGQLAGLAHDGYEGWLSLETHWRGDDQLRASIVCGRSLQRMAQEVQCRTGRATRSEQRGGRRKSPPPNLSSSFDPAHDDLRFG